MGWYDMPRAWSAEDDETLHRMMLEKYSFSQIGKVLNRSRNSCIGRSHRKGWQLERPGKKRNDPAKRSKPHPTPKERPSQALVPAVEEVVEPVELRIVPESEMGLPGAVLSLEQKTCKWPIGDTKHPDFHFCGGTVDDAASVPYCAEHRKTAVQPVGTREWIASRIAWAQRNPEKNLAKTVLRRAYDMGLLAS